MLDSARGAVESDTKKKAESDADTDTGDGSDDLKDGTKKDSTTDPALDPRMVALVLPFAPPATPPALPTKLSLDAAANGQIIKGTKMEPFGAAAAPGDAAVAPHDDAKTVEAAAGDASVGDASDVGKGAAPEEAKAPSAAATLPETPAAKATARDPVKAANGQATAAMAALPSATAAHKTENASIVRAGDLDTYGGSPIAKSAAHASADDGGSNAGKDASKSKDAEATKSAVSSVAVNAADLGAAAATAAGAGRDNALTAANPMAPGAHASANASPDGATTADRAASAQSAANQMVMRNAAHGEIDHPELGRIGVSADLRDGRVDVRVNADRPDAAATLTAHAVHMASDVRAADIPLAGLHIADDASRGSSGNSSNSRHDQAASSSDSESGDAAVQTSILPLSGAWPVDEARVRIVL